MLEFQKWVKCIQERSREWKQGNKSLIRQLYNCSTNYDKSSDV